MPITIVQIYRHPVKGLSPEPLERVALTRGEGVPHDRRFALALATSQFNAAAPAWLPKTNFLMLMKNESLARLRTRFDETSGELTIALDGSCAARGNLLEPQGRAAIEDFFARYMAGEIAGRPRLVAAPGHMFSDVARKVVSIIGLPSLRALEDAIDATLDARRFRANFYVEGSAPWQEFDWIGREFSLGRVRLRGIKRISRCAATNVDPETAARDFDLPRSLRQHFGHGDMGLYAEVLDEETAAVDDELRL